MKTRMKFGDNEIEADGSVPFVTSVIGKFVCFVRRKHLRGKLVRRVLDKPTVITEQPQALIFVAHYRCDRCGATWTRKIKRIEKVPSLTLDIRNAG